MIVDNIWFSESKDSIYRHCVICNSLHPEDFISLLDIYECKLTKLYQGYPSQFTLDKYVFSVQHFADIRDRKERFTAMKITEEKTGVSLAFQ